MLEIEVKAKVNNLELLKEKLSGLGCIFSNQIKQDDIIFLDKSITFPDIKKRVTVLRIRNSDGKFILTLKKSEENELACIEKQIVVDDPGQAKELLEHLGYQAVITVNKTRQKCNYKGLNICLDKVDKLGTFIEVEKITDETDCTKVQDELFEFLMALGVSKEERVLVGYDTLMYKLING
ncbi:MAG: class IV adenylate cyclase [archaeon]|nr:class IV adenylate cyclase [Nanoarchaeota archaeon]